MSSGDATPGALEAAADACRDCPLGAKATHETPAQQELAAWAHWLADLRVAPGRLR